MLRGLLSQFVSPTTPNAPKPGLLRNASNACPCPFVPAAPVRLPAYLSVA